MAVFWTSLGCWRDENASAIEIVEDELTSTYVVYKERNHAIRICAEYANRRNYSVFAIQDGGMCATDQNAEQTYKKYGSSDHCQPDGEGGLWANDVYKLVSEEELAKPSGVPNVLWPMLAVVVVLIAVQVFAILFWRIKKKREKEESSSNENLSRNISLDNVAADENPASDAQFNEGAVVKHVYAVIDEVSAPLSGEGTSTYVNVAVENPYLTPDVRGPNVSSPDEGTSLYVNDIVETQHLTPDIRGPNVSSSGVIGP